MLANWSIEAAKWRLLMQPLQRLSFLTAFKAVFAGTSFAANTPNRVGEYFGRMIYLEEGKRLQSIPLTVTGSYSQLIITLLMGSIGLVFYIQLAQYSMLTTISLFWLKLFLIGAISVTCFALLVYYKLSFIVNIISKLPWLHKYAYFFNTVDGLSTKLLNKVLLLSLLRYMVFLAQYLLVIQAFGIEVAIHQEAVLVAVLFLVMSIIPSFVIVEAGIRGSVSIELFKIVTTNTVGVVATGIFVWLLNLMLPAIIGVLLLLGKRVFKR